MSLSQASQMPNPGRITKRRAPWIKTTQPSQPNHSFPIRSGLLGPWESSITNTIPSRDNCKSLTNFLYNAVVGRLDFDLESSGAFIEIEAKIGRVIDLETQKRLVIPITSEQVCNRNDPHQHVSFASSMSGNQYNTVSKFLDTALVDSRKSSDCWGRAPTKPRVPMAFRRLCESDIFYELSPAAFHSLPQCFHQTLNSRTRLAQPTPKLHVITDLRTNEAVAQVVKVRLDDHTIWSPLTECDYRVTVNLVTNLKRDWRLFVDPSSLEARASCRSNVRLSYRHLSYQIDLSHTTSEKGIRDHELTMEISAAQLRHHALLFRDGQPHNFHKLVQGFSNNLRILAKGSLVVAADGSSRHWR